MVRNQMLNQRKKRKKYIIFSFDSPSNLLNGLVFTRFFHYAPNKFGKMPTDNERKLKFIYFCTRINLSFQFYLGKNTLCLKKSKYLFVVKIKYKEECKEMN